MEPEIDLVMVGDILLHDAIHESGEMADGTYNYDHLFTHVKDDVQEAEIAIVNQEVILGGKKVNRVSLHNYDWVVKNQCGVGSKVDIVLSGDIIPNVLEVYGESSIFNIPYDSFIEGSESMHLMKTSLSVVALRLLTTVHLICTVA